MRLKFWVLIWTHLRCWNLLNTARNAWRGMFTQPIMSIWSWMSRINVSITFTSPWRSLCVNRTVCVWTRMPWISMCKAISCSRRKLHPSRRRMCYRTRMSRHGMPNPINCSRRNVYIDLRLWSRTWMRWFNLFDTFTQFRRFMWGHSLMWSRLGLPWCHMLLTNENGWWNMRIGILL